jgi:hypothetical protein
MWELGLAQSVGGHLCSTQWAHNHHVLDSSDSIKRACRRLKLEQLRTNRQLRAQLARHSVAL